MGKIGETEAHFIRCIKPNREKSASAFDAPLTLEQLKYSGVFEAVAIRKSGYPFRLPHRQFANRYSCIMPAEEAAKLSLGDDALRATVQTMVGVHLPPAKDLVAAAAAIAEAKGLEAPAPSSSSATCASARR